MKDLWFADPLNLIENLLVLVILPTEILRAVMARQLNRLHEIPKIPQGFGFSLLLPSVIAPYRRYFPQSRKPSLLKALRSAELILFLFGLVALFEQRNRY